MVGMLLGRRRRWVALFAVAAAAGGVPVGWAQPAAAADPGTIKAWGDNSQGQLTDIPEGADIAAISGGTLHSLALRRNGTIAAWGNDLGGGAVTNTPASLALSR